MKLKPLLVLAACLGITAVLALVYISHHRAEQRSAINQLFEGRKEARKDCMVKQKGKMILNHQKYLAEIKKLDFTECPKPFQEAWLNYVQTWERLAAPNPIEQQEDAYTKAAIKGKVEADIEGGGSVEGSEKVWGLTGQGKVSGNAKVAGSVEADLTNLKDMAKRLENRDTDDALRKCEQVALDYGVNILKEE